MYYSPSVLKVRNKIAELIVHVCLRPRATVQLERLGTDYGGWWVPTDALVPGKTAYCAGAGEDITFDLALLQAGMRVTIFDPTPRAIEHFRRVAPQDPHLKFEAVGWWDIVDRLKFFAPRDSAHVSHSVVNLQSTSNYFVAPVEPIDVSMNRLGDSEVEIMKMDIEGAEHRVIASIVERGLLPRVLCVEFDQPSPILHVIRSVRLLARGGLSLQKIERWNFTFVADVRNAVALEP